MKIMELPLADNVVVALTIVTETFKIYETPKSKKCETFCQKCCNN